MVPVIVVLFIGAAAAIAWRMKPFQKVKEKLLAWADAYSINLEWWAITARIIFFDMQVITKFSHMQEIEWPFPFDAYISLMDLIFFDLSAWVPSLECSVTWSFYFSLVLWTMTPVALWMLWMCIAFIRLPLERRFHFGRASFVQALKHLDRALVRTH